MASLTYSFNGAVDSSVTKDLNVPTGIIDLLSKGPDSDNPSTNASDAYRCFVQQKFSRNLQAYLVDYNIATNSFYSVFK